MKRVPGYHKDLSYIHNQGFSSFTLEAAPGLLALFRKHHLSDRRIVELGCGGGRLAHVLIQKGFTVTGFDSSPSMIQLARRNAPDGEFSVGSIWNHQIPRCGAVLAVGEVLNYQFQGEVSPKKLRALFSRIQRALSPAGLFVFDILCTRDSNKVLHTKSFVDADGWLVAVEKTDTARSILRRIVSFRKRNGVYRKTTEIHRVQRYNLTTVTSLMKSAGFSVSTRKSYHAKPMEKDHIVVIGRKAGAETKNK